MTRHVTSLVYGVLALLGLLLFAPPAPGAVPYGTDSDLDGCSDAVEAELGTDPQDPDSRPTLALFDEPLTNLQTRELHRLGT